ncbi:MAG: GIY-YIG nuclease family protein [Defluviitaleaceae bacterium]|nr:GIY-YIG nuclease family protein [Defluviitaleaceae bacterium]MCL2275948.1 GIY-YIG nuclease family protein [Defluviitaleaceae bacterium]
MKLLLKRTLAILLTLVIGLQTVQPSPLRAENEHEADCINGVYSNYLHENDTHEIYENETYDYYKIEDDNLCTFEYDDYTYLYTCEYDVYCNFYSIYDEPCCYYEYHTSYFYYFEYYNLYLITPYIDIIAPTFAQIAKPAFVALEKAIRIVSATGGVSMPAVGTNAQFLNTVGGMFMGSGGLMEVPFEYMTEAEIDFWMSQQPRDNPVRRLFESMRNNNSDLDPIGTIRAMQNPETGEVRNIMTVPFEYLTTYFHAFHPTLAEFIGPINLTEADAAWAAGVPFLHNRPAQPLINPNIIIGFYNNIPIFPTHPSNNILVNGVSTSIYRYLLTYGVSEAVTMNGSNIFKIGEWGISHDAGRRNTYFQNIYRNGIFIRREAQGNLGNEPHAMIFGFYYEPVFVISRRTAQLYHLYAVTRFYGMHGTMNWRATVGATSPIMTLTRADIERDWSAIPSIPALNVNLAPANIVTDPEAAASAVQQRAGVAPNQQYVHLWLPDSLEELKAMLALGTNPMETVVIPYTWEEVPATPPIITPPVTTPDEEWREVMNAALRNVHDSVSVMNETINTARAIMVASLTSTMQMVDMLTPNYVILGYTIIDREYAKNKVQQWINDKYEGTNSVGDENGKEERIHYVYIIIFNNTGDVHYVGRTINLDRRYYYHFKRPLAEFDNNYKMIPIASNLTLREARSLEQLLINLYKLKTLRNKINSIAEDRMDEFDEQLRRFNNLLSPTPPIP